MKRYSAILPVVAAFAITSLTSCQKDVFDFSSAFKTSLTFRLATAPAVKQSILLPDPLKIK